MPEIARIETLPVRLPRERATGMAGSPTGLREGTARYRWSKTVHALYSDYIETALVKITLSDGTYGWGEAQAPLAPRVACTIIDDLLTSVLSGETFDGTTGRIAGLWQSMFETMRVRGQTGGFMLDAISGVDLALWDLAGKMQGLSVSKLIAGDKAQVVVPAYLSGVKGPDPVAFAREYFDRGFRTFKIFYDAAPDDLLKQLDDLRNALGSDARIAVDALWRLDFARDREFLRELERWDLYWLEAPFPPDSVEPHVELKRSYSFRIALGESYRTCSELTPYSAVVDVIQPDLGRSGITETIRIARFASQRDVVPHVSIALGPQIAAAIHTSAAIPNCSLCEYNPTVFEASNRYLTESLQMDGPAYRVPERPGLGIDIDEGRLRKDML